MPQHSHRSNMLVPYLGRAELSKAEASNKLHLRSNLLEWHIDSGVAPRGTLTGAPGRLHLLSNLLGRRSCVANVRKQERRPERGGETRTPNAQNCSRDERRGRGTRTGCRPVRSGEPARASWVRRSPSRRRTRGAGRRPRWTVPRREQPPRGRERRSRARERS